jgi:hypothetical protein
MRKLLAKPFWFIADQEDWFNRVGCYIAFGKNWRTKNDPIPPKPSFATAKINGKVFEGTAYCVKCKELREFVGAIKISDSGRQMAQGSCPICGTKVNRILGKVES